MHIQNKKNYSQPYLLLSTLIKVLCNTEWHSFLEEGNSGLGQFSRVECYNVTTLYDCRDLPKHISTEEAMKRLSTLLQLITPSSESILAFTIDQLNEFQMILDKHHYTVRQLMREVGWLQQWYFLHRERISAPDLCFAFSWFQLHQMGYHESYSIAYLLPYSCRNYFIEVFGNLLNS